MKSKRRTRRPQKRVPRGMGTQPTYNFSRTVSQVVRINQGFGFESAGFSSAVSFSLGQMEIWFNGVSAFTTAVPNYTEFTSLFDQYQLRGVEFDVYWCKNVVDGGAGTTSRSLPTIWHALDYDDNATVTIAELSQYPGREITSLGENGGKVMHRRFRPIPSYIGNDGTGSDAKFVALDANQWIDCTYPLVEHKGIKMYLDTFEQYENYDMGSIRIVARLDFAFRSVR